ncbi:MAG: hypothetical protein KY441_04770 [Actinobacteria bacterium]|nr:hypothetical protein [Actinomycetota bacterium]
MRMKRLLGTATAAAVLLAGPLSMAAASAQEADAGAGAASGVGTGSVRSTVLGVDVGSLLNLSVLDDQSISTIDPVNGEPISSAVLNLLSVNSSVLGDLALPLASTSTTGAEDRAEVSRNTAANGIPLPVASGLLSGTLSSVVDEDGARSSLLAGISGDGLDLVGGLLGLGNAPEAVTFTTNAAPATAEGVRGLNIPALDLLNLGNLLAGIGLPLESLPVTDLVGLLEGLGIEGVLVGGEQMATGDLVATVNGLVGSLAPLDAADDAAPLDGGLCQTVDGMLKPLPLVGGIGSIIPGGNADTTCDDVLALPTESVPVVGDLFDNVLDLLEPILGGVLPTLDGFELLSVRDVQAGMVAKATDSLETSVADVVASIGSLKVANLEVFENLDLTQDLALLNGLGDTIGSTLNSALGLSGLLDIDLLKITEEVAPDGDYTKALSSLTAIGVTVNPLVGVLQTGSGELTATDVLGGTGLTGGGMGLLGGLLGGVTSVLSEGAGINVGTMASEGAFTAVAALPPTVVDPPKVATPDGKLPRTGADTALPAAMAVLLAGAALGVRRLARNEQR